MEIKVKGERIYLLRSTPDPGKKRSIQVPVGRSVVGTWVLIPGDSPLTPAEQAQWDAYVAHEQAADERAKLADLPKLLEHFREVLAANPDMVDPHADRWLEALAATEATIKATEKARHPGLVARVAAAIKR
jgi:hypothetical protein